MYMGEKWTREQQIVEELENELRVKDENEANLKEQNMRQVQTINSLNEQVE